jgi:hypothetical protein
MNGTSERVWPRGNGVARKRQIPYVLILLVLLLGSGCSFNRSTVRKGTEEGTKSTPPNLGEDPTIGTDGSKVPAGQTIPAAGLGVDLT